jgi:hypothetical protein
MYSEARKLHIIEAVLKTENEATLEAIEMIVDKEMAVIKPKSKFSDLLGVLTTEEADAMKQTIEENFEKINPDDWK